MFRHQRSVIPMANSLINLQYKHITPDRYKDVMYHLKDVCSQGDPLNRTLCECIKKGGNQFLEYFTFKTLNENLSLMALNNKNQIVGVILNSIATQRDLEDLKYCIEGITDLDLRHLLRLQLEENLKNNIYHIYNIKKAFEIRLLSVDGKNFNGRILGKQLVRLSESLASNKNLKVMKSDATGNFSQKILSYCGFKCLQEKFYDQFKTKDNVRPLKVATIPNAKYQLLYKLLK